MQLMPIGGLVPLRKDAPSQGDVHVDAPLGSTRTFTPGPDVGAKKKKRKTKKLSDVLDEIRKDNQVPPYDNGYGRWLKGHGTDDFGHEILATNKHYAIFFLRKLWDDRYPVAKPEDLALDPKLQWNPNAETGSELTIGYDPKRKRAVLLDGHHRLAMAIQDGETSDLPVKVVKKKVKKPVGIKAKKANIPYDDATGMMKCYEPAADLHNFTTFIPLTKGEATGHPFRGNQYMSGMSGGAGAVDEKAVRAYLQSELGGSRKGIAFRIVSNDDYERMMTTNRVDTSGTRNLEMRERSGLNGMAVSPDGPDLRYISDQNKYRVLALRVEPGEAQQYSPWDEAVTKPLDSTRIIGASDPISRAPDGKNFLIHHERFVEGVGDVDKYLAARPQKPGERSYEYAGRIVAGLTPEQKNELLFIVREKYAPVDYLAEGASRWREQHALPQPQENILDQKVNQFKAQEVADAFDTAEDNSADPEVRAAYDDFKRQNDEQWHFLTDPVAKGGLGVKVDFVDNPEPYMSAEEQAEDLRKNHHIAIAHGLGGAHDATMSPDEYDRFRAVHDSFGHAAIGGGFDRHGEYEAWLQHMTMYTGKGAKAMASEYHGVNSALWSSRPSMPMATRHTGKSILLPDALISNPWDAHGNLIRKAADMTAGLRYLARRLGLDGKWANYYDRAPYHCAPLTKGEASGHPFGGINTALGNPAPASLLPVATRVAP